MSRLTRHEILKEDKFLLTVEAVRDYYLLHRKKIFMIGGGSVLAAALLWGGTYYVTHESQKAKDELSQALKIYHAPVETPGQNPATPGEMSFKSAPEKYQKALTEFQRIRGSYSSGPVGKIAQYYAGLSLLALSRNSEAIAILEPLSKENSDYGALARLALAQAYEAAGDLAKESDVYRKIVDSNSPMTPRSLNIMRLAQLYEQQNKPGEAAKLYQQILKDFPGTPAYTEAEQKLKQAAR